MMKMLIPVFAVVGMVLTNQAIAETYFNSPSGNIVCMGVNSGVYCTIHERNTSKPSCWGDGMTSFYVPSRGKSELDCTSEYFYDDSAPVLSYGQTMRGNGWSCTSQKSGMTCKNSAGRGFSLSRSSQRLF